MCYLFLGDLDRGKNRLSKERTVPGESGSDRIVLPKERKAKSTEKRAEISGTLKIANMLWATLKACLQL